MSLNYCIRPIQGTVEQITVLLTNIISDGDTNEVYVTIGTNIKSFRCTVTQTTNNGCVRRVVTISHIE